VSLVAYFFRDAV